MTSRVKLYNNVVVFSITRSTSIIAVVEVIVYSYESQYIYINVCLCIRLIDKKILWNKNKDSRYGGHGLRSLVTSGLQNFFELLLSFKDKMALLLLLPRLLPPFIQERRRCYIHKQGIHQRPQDERALHIYIYIYV